MILALDLGTKTGWAAYHPDQAPHLRIDSGVINLANKRMDGAGMRYLKLKKWLDGWRPGVNELYFEEVKQRPLSVAAGHVYGGFLATVTSWCEENQVPYSGISVGTIKKFATGLGNAGKPLMIQTANLEGCETNDDNEADAFWLLKYVLHQQQLGAEI